MKINSVIKLLFPLALLIAVTSCGTTTDYAGGGIGGTGISVGKITDFGSVWVNGIEFDTTGARIIKDGVSVLEAVTDDHRDPPEHLRRGMVVTVQYQIDLNGKIAKVNRIEFSDDLEGPISAGSLDLSKMTFEVFGQTVKVESDTDFYGVVGLSALKAGDIVEVSGFTDGNMVVHASYVSLKNEDESDMELKGYITGLDKKQNRFMIGMQTIEFSNETVFERISAGDLDNGLFVEVKSKKGIINGVLIASEIERKEKRRQAEANQKYEVEGYVTDAESVLKDGMFELEGQSVQITQNTIFENGKPDAILVNVKVEAEGTVNDLGILVADKIEIKTGDDNSDGSGQDSGGDNSGDDSYKVAGDDVS